MVGLLIYLLVVTMLFIKATPLQQTIGEKARPNFQPIDDPNQLQWRRKNWPYYLVDPMKRQPPLADGGNVVARQEPRVHPLHRAEWGYRCASVMGVLTVPLMIVAFMNALRNENYFDLFPLRESVWWITLVMTATWTVLLQGVSLTMDQEMGTLESLRLTSIRPRQFLLGKWLGSLRMRWVLITIGTVTVAGTWLGEADNKLEALVAPFVWWGLVELVGLLAFAVSSFCSKTMLAIAASVAAAVAFAAGAVWLYTLLYGSRARQVLAELLPWGGNSLNEFLVFGAPLVLGLIFWLLALTGVHFKWQAER